MSSNSKIFVGERSHSSPTGLPSLWIAEASFWIGLLVIFWAMTPIRSFVDIPIAPFAEWVALGLAFLAVLAAIQVKRRHRMLGSSSADAKLLAQLNEEGARTGNLDRMRLAHGSDEESARQMVVAFDRKYPGVITDRSEKYLKRFNKKSFSQYYPYPISKTINVIMLMIISFIFVLFFTQNLREANYFLAFLLFSVSCLPFYFLCNEIWEVITFNDERDHAIIIFNKANICKNDQDKILHAYSVIYDSENHD